MSVVNCKVAHIRPRYNNLREWMADPANVYVGRAGVVFIDRARFPPQASPFANPFKITAEDTREVVITRYREWLAGKLTAEPALRDLLMSYMGKNLGCWCHPEPCHADVLMEYLRD